MNKKIIVSGMRYGKSLTSHVSFYLANKEVGRLMHFWVPNITIAKKLAEMGVDKKDILVSTGKPGGESLDIIEFESI